MEQAVRTGAGRVSVNRGEMIQTWNKRLLAVTVLLAGFGIMASFSSSVFLNIALERPPYYEFIKHVVFVLIGFAVAGAAYVTLARQSDVMKWLKYVIPVAFMVSIALVALVDFTPLGKSAFGATRSLVIGSFRFQPSEILKIALVLYLAQMLCWWRKLPKGGPARSLGRLRKRAAPSNASEAGGAGSPCWPSLPWQCLAVTLVAMALTVYQPDLGTTGILLGSSLMTMAVAGVDIKRVGLFLAGLAAIVLLALLVVPGKFGYAAKRIDTWLHPMDNVTGASYQLTESRIAVGNGGLFGQGIVNSDQKMNRMPFSTNDFIYPVMVEELGSVGGVVIIGLFLFLALAGLKLSQYIEDPFKRTAVAALGFTICFQAFVNIGTTLGTLPVSGLTLPFFSAGGASLVTTLAAIGIMGGLAANEARICNVKQAK